MARTPRMAQIEALLAEDPDDAFLRYYSWQVYVHTPSGYRRVTGPR